MAERFLLRQAGPGAGDDNAPTGQGARASAVQPQQSDPRFDAETRVWSSDPSGIAPIYIHRDGQAITAAGSEAREVAATFEAPSLDPVAMFQDLTLGFRIGARSLFLGVERLGPDKALGTSNGLEIVNAQADTARPTNAADAIRQVAERTAALAAEGAMIELSGGVDSRVVLALALAGGCAPRQALTLGDEDSPDVIASRAIAERFGIEQVVIKPDPAPDSIAGDAAAFARASGYACSTTSYAWLPAVFRQLDARRDTQLSGVGGERAGGFYYTPADRFASVPGFLSQWIRLRLRTPGIDPARVFRPAVIARLRAETDRAVRDALGEVTGPWRARTDNLYEFHRLRMWAGASFRAATHWYRSETPMLWPAFTPWIREIARTSGDPRGGLVRLIAELSPELAAMPYANDIRPAGAPPKAQPKPIRIAKKAIKRLRQTRKAPELGASRAAAALIADPAIRERIEALLDAQADVLDVRAIRELLATPEQSAHELGFLLTWSLAHHDLTHPPATAPATHATNQTPASAPA